ncbi:MAG TPA: N-acetylneuraminate synthase family protein [Candidatus Limnocylindrales bacterium]|nr:N-acetylneuraminate synthase family protein [Candidatus Limnocylindrales bacterium]
MSGTILFLIPARGGSSRVPGKNLRTVAGIPLVGHAVRNARLAAARVPGGPHRVVCSTDDAAIAAVARAWGAEVIDRPAGLASAAATSVDVALHAIDVFAGASIRAIVLVQPTSPLTDPADLVAAVERFDANLGRSVTSVTRAHPAGWHVAREPGLDGAEGSIRRIDAEDVSEVLSGAIYVVAPDDLRTGRLFVGPGSIGLPIPLERSVDIDEPEDLVVAEAFAAARPIRPVQIAGRRIGSGPVFIIAEGGVNHDGRVELAHRLVDAAADAGADAVKFQTFDPAALAAAGAPTAEYQRRSAAGGTDQRSMLSALALPADAWAAIRDHAHERGLVFLSTPFDDASADLLDALGVPAFKVASGELTNLPFIGRLARRGRPLLVSTGMAEMVEVAQAVDAIAAAGDPPIALFHCVSSYPARPEDANLRAIATMRAAFAVPVGWSDHTLGIELPLAAVAAGATLVEKHLTLDRTLPGPDHAASLEPTELRAMVAGIRTVESALGSGDKRPVEAERAVAAVARKSLHWARSLPPGSPISEADLAAMRPGTGLSPARQVDLVGRRTARAVTAGQPVDPADTEGFQ